MRTTIGKLLVNEALPAKFQDLNRIYTADETNAVLASIAKEHPEQYRDISHKLMQLGREGSYVEGATLGLSDMRTGIDRKELLQHIADQTKVIVNTKNMTEEQKQQALIAVYSKVQKFFVDTTYQQALADQNPFALQVFSKARGNPSQLAALLTTPGLYTDANDKIIPTFIERSYAEGLRPHEYWAGTYGARKSVISTKFATRDAGYLGKQFNQSAMRTIVTSPDCETNSGIPVSPEDMDNLGAVLNRAAGGFPAGTVLSKEVLSKINDKKVDEIIVRSPLTCNAEQGVCKQCVGLRENGEFPKMGDHVGLNASSALAERIAQGSLNTKHSGGMAKGDKSDKVYAGFDVIEQLFQVPKTFPNRASVSTADGTVERIEDAPQGGWNVFIKGQPHYVLPDVAVSVKPGEQVEAGDQISSGILNPADVVQYKGIGEGRRYFAERATQAFRDSGYAVNRRNMELLTRGMIDHTIINDPQGANTALPGDVVSYNQLAFQYRPRPEAKMRNLKEAYGKYMEQPAMHYTIGTRITKKVADKLTKFGHTTVLSHEAPPEFEPYMVSLRAVPQYEDDWMAQLGSSYLQANLLKQVHRGGESRVHGLHPVPGLAKGTEFGQTKGVGY